MNIRATSGRSRTRAASARWATPSAATSCRCFLKINDETGVIEDVKFKTFGCGAAVATSSMATEMIKGRTVDEALKLSNAAVVEALEGLPPQKIHCSVLAEEAVKAAIEDYQKKKKAE